MKRYTKGLNAALITSIFTLTSHSTYANEQGINEYQIHTSLHGQISSTGSDTLASLMKFWTDDFREMYPLITVTLHSEGSATAPPALSNGAANIAPMSRKMTQDELDSFRYRFGYHPTAIKVAIDAIAIFVHKNNSLSYITLPQLEHIFSGDEKCTGGEPIRYWHQLQNSNQTNNQAIDVYGRNSESGTYGFFKKVALCNGDYIESMQRLPGNASIVQAVSSNPNGIGFSALGYKTSGVRTLPVKYKGNATLPAKTWDYPLARYLYLYVNKAPNTELPPVVNEFLLYVLSKNGQSIVEQDGYTALPQALVKQERQKLVN